MDISKFIKHYISKNQIDIIKYGVQNSIFNSEVKYSAICETILKQYKYSNFISMQSGLPVMTRNNDKKISYYRNFHNALNNIQVLYNYELAKYLLVRVNSKDILNKIYNDILQNKNSEYEILTSIFNYWIKFYNMNNYKIQNKDSFQKIFIKTKFYNKHNSLNIQSIQRGILQDLSELSTLPVNMAEEIIDELINVIKILMETSQSGNTSLIFDHVRDIIIDLDKYDIGYNGSFIHALIDFHDLDSNLEPLIEEYKLNEIIYNSIEIKFIDYMKQFLNELNKFNPQCEIKLSKSFQTEFLQILLDMYIHIGIEIAEQYNSILCFEKTARIHFKTIYSSFIKIKYKNYKFTESQLAALYYVLLNNNEIEKSIEMIQES